MGFSGRVYAAASGATFRLIKPPYCRFCHAPLDPSKNYWRCFTCHKVDRDLGIRYSFDQARAAGVYSSQRRNSVSEHIVRNKRDPAVAPVLAEVMSDVIRTDFPHLSRADAVASVPMLLQELEEKGFNHSQEIAKHLSKLLGLPLVPDMLAKDREPPKSQHES